MSNLQAIINDIQSLRGANVRVFGQPTTLADTVEETTIDILDVLKHVEGHEKTEFEYEVETYDEEEDEYYYNTEQWEALEEYLEWLDNMGELKEVGSDNSYNWSSPISNDFQFAIFNDTLNNVYLVRLMVHRFGDVRGNYTDYCLLEFNSEYEFYEALSECRKVIETDKYYVEVDIMHDMMEVYDKEWNQIKSISDLDELEEE